MFFFPTFEYAKSPSRQSIRWVCLPSIYASPLLKATKCVQVAIKRFFFGVWGASSSALEGCLQVLIPLQLPIKDSDIFPLQQYHCLSPLPCLLQNRAEVCILYYQRLKLPHTTSLLVLAREVASESHDGNRIQHFVGCAGFNQEKGY